jgi:phage-related protein
MIFRRKKKLPVRKPRLNADDVIIGAAKTIGAAIGAASGAVEIGKKTAAEARKIDTDGLKSAAVEKQGQVAQKAVQVRKQASQQVEVTKDLMAKKAAETKKQAEETAIQAKKLTAAKAKETRKKAGAKVDELREAAADKIAPKRKRGLLARIRG